MGWVVLRVPLKEILLEYTSLSGDPQQFGVFCCWAHAYFRQRVGFSSLVRFEVSRLGF